MEGKKIGENKWMVRIKRGEKIIEQLVEFCEEKGIEGGYLVGIGAVDYVELALYDVEKQEYFSEKFEGAYELANLTGTIGVEEELIVHAHATLSDSEMRTIGGHLVEARVSGTAEIVVTMCEKLVKKHDEETGLKLFDLG